MYDVIVHYHSRNTERDIDAYDSFRDIRSLDISDDKKLLTMTYKDGITYFVPINQNVRLIVTQVKDY